MNQLARPSLIDKFSQFFGTALPPHVSTATQRFTLVNQAGIERPINKTSINVVVLDIGNSVSRFYYAEGYDPKNKMPPACFSLNGKIPENGVDEPQAASCALCPHSFFGSADNGKGKACREQIPLAIFLPEDAPNEVFQFNIPPATQKTFKAYLLELKTNNFDLCNVVTNISFSPTEQGKLILQRVAILLPEWQQKVYALIDSGVAKIVLPVSNVDPAAQLSAPRAMPQLQQQQTAPPQFLQQQGQLPPPSVQQYPPPVTLPSEPLTKVPDEPKKRGRKPKAPEEQSAPQAVQATALPPLASAQPAPSADLDIPQFLRRENPPNGVSAYPAPSFGLQASAPDPEAELQAKLAAAFALPTG